MRWTVVVVALGIIAAAGVAEAQPKVKDLQCDEVVKNPVGYVTKIYDTEQECKDDLANLYEEARARGESFCRRWYRCPPEWPLYYAPGADKDGACSCRQLGPPNEGKWLGVCDLNWNGLCGCKSPSDNPSSTHLQAPLTSLESSQVADWYPQASACLSEIFQGQSPSFITTFLQAMADSIEAHLDGHAFTTVLASHNDTLRLSVSLSALADSVPGVVEHVDVVGDDASVIERGSLPGGVRRGLMTAMSNAIGTLAPLLAVGQRGNPSGSTLQVWSPRPNPAQRGAIIQFYLSRPQEVEVAVFDIAGRLVRVLLKPERRDVGLYSIEWDGYDGHGTRAANRVYFVRVRTGDRQEVRKVVTLE